MGYAPPFKADMSGWYNNLPRVRRARERQEKIEDKNLELLDRRLKSMDQMYDLRQGQLDLQKDQFGLQQQQWESMAKSQQLQQEQMAVQTQQLLGEMNAQQILGAARQNTDIFQDNYLGAMDSMVNQLAQNADPATRAALYKNRPAFHQDSITMRQAQLTRAHKELGDHVGALEKAVQVEGHPSGGNTVSGTLSKMKGAIGDIEKWMIGDAGDLDLRVLSPGSVLAGVDPRTRRASILAEGKDIGEHGQTRSLKPIQSSTQIGGQTVLFQLIPPEEEGGSWTGMHVPGGVENFQDTDEKGNPRIRQIPVQQSTRDFTVDLGPGTQAEALQRMRDTMSQVNADRFLRKEETGAINYSQDVMSVANDVAQVFDVGTTQGTDTWLAQKIVEGDDLEAVHSTLAVSAFTPNATTAEVRQSLESIIEKNPNGDGKISYADTIAFLESKPMWAPGDDPSKHPLNMIAAENQEQVDAYNETELNLSASALQNLDPRQYSRGETLGAGMLQNMRNVSVGGGSNRISTDYMDRLLEKQGGVLQRALDGFHAWAVGRNPPYQRILAAATVVKPMMLVARTAHDRTLIAKQKELALRANNVDDTGQVRRYLPQALQYVLTNEELLKKAPASFNMVDDDFGEAVAQAENDAESRPYVFDVIRAMSFVSQTDPRGIFNSRHVRDKKGMRHAFDQFVVKTHLGPRWSRIAGFDMKQGAIEVDPLVFRHKTSGYTERVNVYLDVDGRGGLLLHSHTMPGLKQGFYVGPDAQHEYEMLIDGIYTSNGWVQEG